MTELATALKAARESKGWTQRRLADEARSAGRELSSAYVGLIEAGHRIPTEAVVRVFAEVLEHDADELIELRSQAELDRLLDSLGPTRLSDLDPATTAKGRKWIHDLLASNRHTSVRALSRLEDVLAQADRPRPSPGTSVATEAASAWLSRADGPRRGRRFELATRLFELVAELDSDDLQRVIGYTEAVIESRRPPPGNPGEGDLH